jgi:hypothetical protein
MNQIPFSVAKSALFPKKELTRHVARGMVQVEAIQAPAVPAERHTLRFIRPHFPGSAISNSRLFQNVVPRSS